MYLLLGSASKTHAVQFSR